MHEYGCLRSTARTYSGTQTKVEGQLEAASMAINVTSLFSGFVRAPACSCASGVVAAALWNRRATRPLPAQYDGLCVGHAVRGLVVLMSSGSLFSQFAVPSLSDVEAKHATAGAKAVPPRPAGAAQRVAQGRHGSNTTSRGAAASATAPGASATVAQTVRAPPARPAGVQPPAHTTTGAAPRASGAAASATSAATNASAGGAANASFDSLFAGATRSKHYRPLGRAATAPPHPPQHHNQPQNRYSGNGGGRGRGGGRGGAVGPARSASAMAAPPGARIAFRVHPRQVKNPVLKLVCNVPWRVDADIVPDYVLGKTTCAVYLSLRYHTLHPNYVHQRIRQVGRSFTLRLLLVLVDVGDNERPIQVRW